MLPPLAHSFQNDVASVILSTLVGGIRSGTLALPAALAAGGETAAAAAEAAEAAGALEVGRCRLTVSKPVLKAPMVSALDTIIS